MKSEIYEVEDEFKTRKILGFLGLARRAKCLIYGKDGIRSYIKKRNEMKLIVVTKDIGDRIFSDILKRSMHENMIILILKKVNKIELGRSIGKSIVSAVALSSANIIKGILELLESDGISKKSR